jgi:hypothetical protein
MRQMCKDCGNFILNGCVKSFDVIYNSRNATKMGNCKIDNTLKNELNLCHIEREIKTR